MASSKESVYQLFISPFEKILPFYLLGLILSACIIICLIILEWAIQKFDIITMSFRSMFKVHRRRLRCFNVDITASTEYRRIQTSCTWMLRILLATILCFLWQSCIMFQHTWRMSSGKLEEDTIVSLCGSGLVCVYYGSVYDIYILWAKFGSYVDVCGSVKAQTLKNSINFRSGYVTCVGLVPMDSQTFVVKLAVAYALAQLITGFFQLFAFFIFRSPFFNWFYSVVSFILIALYFCSLVFPGLFFLDTWFTSASYIAVPLILLCARAAGLATRQRLNDQLVLVDKLRLEEIGLDSREHDFSQIMRESWTPAYKKSLDLSPTTPSIVSRSFRSRTSTVSERPYSIDHLSVEGKRWK